MNIKDLAPWIAISITLALSILVPLFTQIANNKHQRKMMREQYEHEERQKKREVFEAFLSEVGGAITARANMNREKFIDAGSALHRLYIYAPTEWYDDLDKITECISTYEWDKARALVQKMSRLIAEELVKL